SCGHMIQTSFANLHLSARALVRSLRAAHLCLQPRNATPTLFRELQQAPPKAGYEQSPAHCVPAHPDQLHDAIRLVPPTARQCPRVPVAAIALAFDMLGRDALFVLVTIQLPPKRSHVHRRPELPAMSAIKEMIWAPPLAVVSGATQVEPL